MTKVWKKYINAKKKVDVLKKYSVADAVVLSKDVSYSKFIWSLELHIKTFANPKYNDQILRWTLVLPNGTWKKIRVAAFVSDDKIDEVIKAWADIAWNLELITSIEKWDIKFDVLVTSADMMRDLAKAAKILWPKGLMPSPKAGTISNNLPKTIDELKKGRVEYKLDKTWNIHVVVGKLDFSNEDLSENIEVLLKTIKDNKPSWVKWPLIKKIALAPTMWPAIQIWF